MPHFFYRRMQWIMFIMPLLFEPVQLEIFCGAISGILLPALSRIKVSGIHLVIPSTVATLGLRRDAALDPVHFIRTIRDEVDLSNNYG